MFSARSPAAPSVLFPGTSQSAHCCPHLGDLLVKYTAVFQNANTDHFIFVPLPSRKQLCRIKNRPTCLRNLNSS